MDEKAAEERGSNFKEGSATAGPQWPPEPETKRKPPADRNMSSIHSILNAEDPLYRRRSSSVATVAAIDDKPHPVQPLLSRESEPAEQSQSDQNEQLTPEAIEPTIKRGRGRPRKYSKEIQPKMPKRPRGRPRKSVSYDTGHRSVCENYIALSNAICEKLNDGRTPRFNWMIAKSRSLIQAYLVAGSDEGILTDSQAEELERDAKVDWS